MRMVSGTVRSRSGRCWWGGRWTSHSATMAPNAAACSLLAGVSLWLLRKKDKQHVAEARNLAAKTPAAIVALAGTRSLAEPLFGRDPGSERKKLERRCTPAGSR
jgi:hypothetical protein